MFLICVFRSRGIGVGIVRAQPTEEEKKTAGYGERPYDRSVYGVFLDLNKDWILDNGRDESTAMGI
jgi:hypothetical protein